MASFSAELRVAGNVFPVLDCLYGTTQPTRQRGRVGAPVRYELISLTLDMPDGDFLTTWAADPHKHFAASLVFRDADGGVALETATLPAAYCVRYAESFVAGDTDTGAYQCLLTLAAPDGFSIQAGEPAPNVSADTPSTPDSIPEVPAA